MVSSACTTMPMDSNCIFVVANLNIALENINAFNGENIDQANALNGKWHAFFFFVV